MLCLQVSDGLHLYLPFLLPWSLSNKADASILTRCYTHFSPFEQDGYLLTAQIASIVATLISWVWWPLFVISAPIVVLLQVAWCCKMKKAGMVAACVLSLLATVGGLFVGIWMATQCFQGIFVVMMNRDDDYYYGYDSCHRYMHHPHAWTVVAFVDCFLFLLTFLCVTWFTVVRYDINAARWTAQDEADADEVVVPVVEMGVIRSSAPQATATILSHDEKNMDQA